MTPVNNMEISDLLQEALSIRYVDALRVVPLSFGFAVFPLDRSKEPVICEHLDEDLLRRMSKEQVERSETRKSLEVPKERQRISIADIDI